MGTDYYPRLIVGARLGKLAGDVVRVSPVVRHEVVLAGKTYARKGGELAKTPRELLDAVEAAGLRLFDLGVFGAEWWYVGVHVLPAGRDPLWGYEHGYQRVCQWPGVTPEDVSRAALEATKGLQALFGDDAPPALVHAVLEINS